MFTADARAQTQAPAQAQDSLKRLSLEELMNIEVTSVSRSPQELSKTASAIQVITQTDIRRSGATRLPEVLRLASNLEVDQLDSTQWAISSRGFNSPLANKLLVLIDGRTVYSPLFAGVFWDAQDVLLEDIDRIEVISGPGATLWGANAVNGVINITTKRARDTQRLFLEGGVGTELRRFANARYGAAIAPNVHFRVYGKYTRRDSSDLLSSGEDAGNEWRMNQGGFRMDWDASQTDLFTLQGDLYEERISLASAPDPFATGGNLIGRWSRTVSENSDFKLQMYFDRTHRDIPGSYNDALNTYDVDFQHRLRINKRNQVVWGAGYRLFEDNFGPGSLIVVPRRASKQTFSAFVQDGIAFAQDRFDLTLGTKLEHNDYTGFEVQPSARLAWQPAEKQTMWAAISRAIRAPSRLDRDLIVPPIYAGGPDFESEVLLAYELGFRALPHERLSLAIASYYNDYGKLRSTELGSPSAPIPLVFANGQYGESYGAELTADYQSADWWRIRAGYTEQRVHIRPRPGSADVSFGQAEAADSNHRFSLRSSLDLPRHVEFDAVFRYASRNTNPRITISGYSELDMHLSWQPSARVDLSIVGQNLLHDHHIEFGNAATLQEIERSVYGKIAYQW
jgi:iron complex outermembrane recepter protein